MAHPAPLAITSGEPAGIGIDICLQLNAEALPRNVVVLADKTVVKERAALLGRPYQWPDFDPDHPAAISLCHLPSAVAVHAGQLDARNSPYVLALLDRAYHGICQGEFSAMVTAPLHKGIIQEGCPDLARPFCGHTEYLADLSATKHVVMMLTGNGLRVALATTHLPLKDVASTLNQQQLMVDLRIIIKDLQRYFGIKSPRLAVCGLNPHAGENGHMGQEEITIIGPVIHKLQQEGLQVHGPFPADTIFQPAILETHDVVVAMYHDQGLPVLKYAAFGQAVNITLGLPFVRTSVDHGTALALAGTGKANPSSLIAALETANRMANHG